MSATPQTAVGSERLDDPSEFDILYTSLEEAVEELAHRRADSELCAQVAEFQKGLMPPFLSSEPQAVICRAVFTPNYELATFVESACFAGLKPLLLEFSQHIFVSQNRSKLNLCRPIFELRPDHTRGLRVASNYGQSDGVRMASMGTLNGQSLAEFHHALMHLAYPRISQKIFDVSSWLTTARKAEGEYPYLHYLACFIRDGILFENFTFDDEQERQFTRERVLPSFHRAMEIFGVKPLIVPLVPREREAESRWGWHLGILYRPACRLLQRHHS
jgi:hypothetical protein